MMFSWIFIAWVEVSIFRFSTGEGCQSLVGVWYNELGSRLTLDQTEDGILFGTYTMSAVPELGPDSDNGQHSNVKGIDALDEPAVVFGFNIISKDGAFVKSWIGQCLVCEDKEKLMTTWLLRRSVDYCTQWEAISIGESSFVRRDQVEPLHNHEKDCGVDNKNSELKTPPELNSIPSATVAPPLLTNDTCSLDGMWFNQHGSRMNLTVHNDMSLTGLYLTSVQSRPGAAGKGHQQIHGMTAHNLQNSTMAMNVVWNNGTSITGWVGQCRLCGTNNAEMLMTSWLLRTKVSSCSGNWMATRYGQDVFTRRQQK